MAARQVRFEALVLPHLDRLVGFAARHLGNRADAEDVVQESCIRAWDGFDSLRDDGRLRPWLYRILRTALSDFCDRRGRRERLAPTTALDDPESFPTGDPGPLDRLVDALSAEELARLLRGMPEEFSLAVQLHDIEGFAYREVAEITAVPLGTVMSRIYRGRRLLATRLVPQHTESESRGPRLVAAAGEGKKEERNA